MLILTLGVFLTSYLTYFFFFYLLTYTRSQKAIDQATKDGQEQLEMLKRQRLIGNFYPSDVSVMDS